MVPTVYAFTQLLRCIWDTSATPTSGSVTYAFTADGNPGSIASGTITAGAVTLAGTLNYEAAQSYTFKVV